MPPGKSIHPNEQLVEGGIAVERSEPPESELTLLMK